MARGKKKETLTPEERLQATLVPESEQPYPVPGNWCWVKVGTISKVKGGKRLPKGRTFLEEKSDYPYIRVTDFDNESICIENVKYIDSDTHMMIKNYTISSADIYISIAGTIGKVGIIPEELEGANLTENAAKITDINGAYQLYLMLFLKSEVAQNQMKDSTISTTQPKLALFRIEDILLPLPPFSEQQRIVNRIESLFAKLDEAKQKAQDALGGFETCKAAILHKAFTGELTTQWRKEHGIGMESWEKLKIGTYAQVKGGKRLPKGHKLVTERTAHPYLRIADFGDRTINDSDLHYITEDTFSQIKNYIINKEDVYISIVGSIGKAGVIPESLNGANLTENAARIISSRTLPRYLSSFLSSPKAQNDIQNRIRSATLGKLSLLNIKDIETPIPSIEEQTEIIRILDDLLAKEQQAKEAAEGVLEQIDLIKKSILARAFRGELGTNDPSEESAVELLKQVL